jgi:uncharacterized protein (TIGR04255 family)
MSMSTGPSPLPGPGEPPVIETALGVQFAPIRGLTSAHYGWFWKGYLDETWTKAEDAAILPNQFEKFGEEVKWVIPSLPRLIPTPPAPTRIMLINELDDRIIQVQNNKFFYNWRRRLAPYSSFDDNYPEFRRWLGIFEGFIRDAGLEVTPHNQWELTYFNHIPKGSLWTSPSDWRDILPGLYGQLRSRVPVVPDPSGEWRFEIPPKRGRLYVEVQHAKTKEDVEILNLQLTARGPIVAGEDGWDLAAGMNIGHDAIVQTFRGISSPDSLAYWGLE